MDSTFCVSWSGGKDCCIALRRALRDGARCGGLACVLGEDGLRSRSHGLRPEVLAAQADAMGLPLRTARASWATYEREFSALLSQAREEGAREIVYGDIELQDHRDWQERVCGAVGLTARFPLWHVARRELLSDLLGAGFRAILVGVREDRLPRAMLGRELDWALVEELEALGADACGEEGEFHTLVVDGPLFRWPLQVLAGSAEWEEWGTRYVDVRLKP